jgi:DNA-binding response OmpR family regulator
MNNDHTDPRQKILLIDRQHSWLQRSAEALCSAGFEVDSLDRYDYPDQLARSKNTRPTLVVLGCASIGPEELLLIDRVLQNKDHLIVMSTSLPSQIMRQVFLVGADDVTDKPYNVKNLVEIVNQVLHSISPTR